MVHKKTVSDRVFSAFIIIVVSAVLISVLYPIIYVFSMSISDSHAAMRGDVILLPIGFDTTAYQTVLSNKSLGLYYGNTLWYTIVGTVCNVAVTILAAYPLSKQRFRARKFFTTMFTFTMFFSGGLIPTYLLVTSLGLYNSRWAVILPTLTGAYNIIVARTFFQSLPEEMFDGARIDGAGEFRVLWQIVLPLSKPILAVLALWCGVAHWNSYFPEMLYLGDPALQPMQLYLRRVVIQASPEAMQNFNAQAVGGGVLSMMQVKYAVMIITMAPIIAMYPFLQKYFVKGMMIGSLKG